MNDDNIFNINKFRDKKVNYYNSFNNCAKDSHKISKKKRVQTNPKFTSFDQIYFTAGDEKDVNKYALLPTRYFFSQEVDITKKITDKNYFKLYKNIDYISIKNTFDYMFHKFKKGIYVIIKNNKLFLYLPFSKANYKNNWVKQTYFTKDEKRLLENNNYKHIKKELDKNIIEFQKKYPQQFQYGRKIDFDREKWYANNCNFRNLVPRYEGELNTNVYKDLLETLVKERTIPDVEFFINDRDFPLLKKDFTEPYNHLYDGDNIKIEEKYQFKKMAPIFSKSITNEFADILIPTNDDWVKESNHYFVDDCSNKLHKDEWAKINMDWKDKKDICIFRGSATGCGITIDNNIRLKAAYLSTQYPNILDAAITDWNARPKKYTDRPIEIIDTSKLNFKLGNKITNIEKSNYKYILYMDGYVSAFRLSSELSMNSVVLIVHSEYKLWFSDLLVEYKHYIPVKNDLSNLIEQIEWCISNDKLCKKIAKNSVEFYNKYLTKDTILNYMQNKLNVIHSHKNFKNLLDIKKEKKKIAIISCFRNNSNGTREKERKKFIQIMNTLLKPYCDFYIYIIEQSDDNEKFNIGKLKNIGFKIACKDKKYDNYIFSDIDTIPDYELLPYFLKKLDYPISYAIRGTRYEEIDVKTNKPFMGALIGFSKKVFEKINGYPNNMYGWGGEDDAIILRIISNGLYKIYYPKDGSTIDFEETIDGKTMDIKNKLKITNKEKIKYEKLYEDLRSWNKNGINSLNYNELERNIINDNTIQIKVDLLKKEDEKEFPHLYNIKLNNYEKLKDTIKKEYYKITKTYI